MEQYQRKIRMVYLSRICTKTFCSVSFVNSRGDIGLVKIPSQRDLKQNRRIFYATAETIRGRGDTTSMKGTEARKAPVNTATLNPVKRSRQRRLSFNVNVWRRSNLIKKREEGKGEYLNGRGERYKPRIHEIEIEAGEWISRRKVKSLKKKAEHFSCPPSFLKNRSRTRGRQNAFVCSRWKKESPILYVQGGSRNWGRSYLAFNRSPKESCFRKV